MKKIAFSLLIFIGLQAQAQVISDALRWSTITSYSTGRSTALVGTMSNLGGDQFAIFSNPAGLATFRKSQITISPGYINKYTESNFASNKEINSNYRFSMANLGLVSAREQNASKWKTINFSVTYNKLADYNQSYSYSGESKGSITDRWKENAQGLDTMEFNAFEEGLAADAGVLFIIDKNDKSYGTDYDTEPNKSEKLFKSQSINSQGYMGEITLAFAGNLEEKVQIGGSVGIRLLDYSVNKDYVEDASFNSKIINFKRLNFTEYVFTSGAGFNFNLGIIYKPNNSLRISGAFHSPTFWNLTDNYYNDLSYSYADDDNNVFKSAVESPEGIFKYGLKDPMRMNGGIGYILGRRGFISGEVEWTDYRTSTFNLLKNSQNSEDRKTQNVLNNAIRDAYSTSLSYKLGAEMAMGSFRVRGGYVLRQRPYANDDAFDYAFAGGLGLNSERIFFDIGFLRFKESSGYVPYLVGNPDIHPIQLIKNKIWTTQLNFTLGFRI